MSPLRVLTAEVVGFVHLPARQEDDRFHGRPVQFHDFEDGKPMSGHKVLGRFVKLHHMGTCSEPYFAGHPRRHHLRKAAETDGGRQDPLRLSVKGHRIEKG